MSSTPEVPKNRSKAGAARIIIVALAIALVLGVILYAVGWWQGRAQLNEQRQGFEAQIERLETELAVARNQIKVEANRAQVIEARSALLHTALDLERRNFGLANERLREAVAALDQVQPAGSIDPNRLKSIRDSIAATDVNVATNLQDQRNQVLAFAAQLDGLLGE